MQEIHPVAFQTSRIQTTVYLPSTPSVLTPLGAFRTFAFVTADLLST